MSDPLEPYTYHLCVVSSKTVLLFGNLLQAGKSSKEDLSEEDLSEEDLSEENLSYSSEQYIQKCKAVDILSLARKFDMNELLFFHKAINNLVPVSLPQYLSFY